MTGEEEEQKKNKRPYTVGQKRLAKTGHASKIVCTSFVLKKSSLNSWVLQRLHPYRARVDLNSIHRRKCITMQLQSMHDLTDGVATWVVYVPTRGHRDAPSQSIHQKLKPPCFDMLVTLTGRSPPERASQMYYQIWQALSFQKVSLTGPNSLSSGKGTRPTQCFENICTHRLDLAKLAGSRMQMADGEECTRCMTDSSQQYLRRNPPAFPRVDQHHPSMLLSLLIY